MRYIVICDEMLLNKKMSLSFSGYYISMNKLEKDWKIFAKFD